MNLGLPGDNLSLNHLSNMILLNLLFSYIIFSYLVIYNICIIIITNNPPLANLVFLDKMKLSANVKVIFQTDTHNIKKMQVIAFY